MWVYNSVCMCMYVCMYVCMYICMYVCKRSSLFIPKMLPIAWMYKYREASSGWKERSAYIHTYTYIHTYIRTYIHTYIKLSIPLFLCGLFIPKEERNTEYHVCMYVCVCMHICVYAHVCVCICVCVCLWIRESMYLWVYGLVYAGMYERMFFCMSWMPCAFELSTSIYTYVCVCHGPWPWPCVLVAVCLGFFIVAICVCVCVYVSTLLFISTSRWCTYMHTHVVSLLCVRTKSLSVIYTTSIGQRFTGS